MRKSLIVGGVLLAACTPAGEKAVELDPVLAGDLTLIGTEPFWSVAVVEATKSTTLTRPDAAAVTGEMPERKGTVDGANFKVKTADGEMTIALKKATCSDGMSDRSYPYEAEVNWQGQALKGCAIATSEMERMPPA